MSLLLEARFFIILQHSLDKLAHDGSLLLLNLLHLNFELRIGTRQGIDFLLELVRKFNELLLLSEVELLGEVRFILALTHLLSQLQTFLTMGSLLLLRFESNLLPELFVLLVEIEDLHPEEGLLFLLFLNEVHELLNLVLDSYICTLILLDSRIQLVLETFKLAHLTLDRILELLDIQHI